MDFLQNENLTKSGDLTTGELINRLTLMGINVERIRENRGELKKLYDVNILMKENKNKIKDLLFNDYNKMKNYNNSNKRNIQEFQTYNDKNKNDFLNKSSRNQNAKGNEFYLQNNKINSFSSQPFMKYNNMQSHQTYNRIPQNSYQSTTQNNKQSRLEFNNFSQYPYQSAKQNDKQIYNNNNNAPQYFSQTIKQNDMYNNPGYNNTPQYSYELTKQNDHQKINQNRSNNNKNEFVKEKRSLERNDQISTNKQENRNEKFNPFPNNSFKPFLNNIKKEESSIQKSIFSNNNNPKPLDNKYFFVNGNTNNIVNNNPDTLNIMNQKYSKIPTSNNNNNINNSNYQINNDINEPLTTYDIVPLSCNDPEAAKKWRTKKYNEVEATLNREQNALNTKETFHIIERNESRNIPLFSILFILLLIIFVVFFYDSISSPLREFLQYRLSGISTFQMINLVLVVILAIVVGICIILIKKRKSQKIYKIFNRIRNDINESHQNNIYSYISEEEIVNRYSEIFHEDPENFRTSILPKLRELRKLDKNLKLRIEYIDGSSCEVWFWKQ